MSLIARRMSTKNETIQTRKANTQQEVVSHHWDTSCKPSSLCQWSSRPQVWTGVDRKEAEFHLFPLYLQWIRNRNTDMVRFCAVRSMFRLRNSKWQHLILASYNCLIFDCCTWIYRTGFRDLENMQHSTLGRKKSSTMNKRKKIYGLGYTGAHYLLDP